MELKKNPKADLSKKSGLLLNIGFTVSLLLCIAAFEWRTYDESSLVDLGQVQDDFEDILDIPVTNQPPPPPPKIQLPEVVEVDDDIEIEEEIEVELDVEVTEKTVIEDIVFSDAPPAEEVVEEVFTIVEDQPEFPGGMAAFYKFIGDNMQYPSQARRMGIEGRVYVQFVVDKDGTVTDVTAVKGIGAGCDEEAVRVLKTAPKFKPGKQRGRPVKVRMVLPIIFKLS